MSFSSTEIESYYTVPNNNPKFSDQADISNDSIPVYDNVNSPFHYTSGKYEVIDIIEDQFGAEGVKNFCLGNCIKYLCRAGKKDPTKKLEDYQKARWYLNHLIKTEEKGRE